MLGPGVGTTPPGDGTGVGAMSGVQYGFWQQLLAGSWTRVQYAGMLG